MKIRKARIANRATGNPICEFTIGSNTDMDVETQAMFVLLSLDLSKGWSDPRQIYDLLVTIRLNEDDFVREMAKKYVVTEDTQIDKLNGDEPLSVTDLLWLSSE